MKLKYLFLAITLGSASTITKAQDYDLGAFAGFSFYQGDLSPGLSNGVVNAFRGFRPAIGALGRYNFHPNFSVRGNLTVGYLAAYDRYGNKGTSREERDLSFHTPLIEASVVGEVNLMKYIAGSRRYKFAPFIYAGIGAFYFEPATYLDGNKEKLRKQETEPGKKYSPVSIAIPVGFGVKYNYRDDMTISFEMGFRKTFTDYIDDVSDKYPASAYSISSTSALSDRLSNRTGKTLSAGTMRGNPGYKDAYLFVGVTIYKTIRPYKCARF